MFFFFLLGELFFYHHQKRFGFGGSGLTEAALRVLVEKLGCPEEETVILALLGLSSLGWNYDDADDADGHIFTIGFCYQSCCCCLPLFFWMVNMEVQRSDLVVLLRIWDV